MNSVTSKRHAALVLIGLIAAAPACAATAEDEATVAASADDLKASSVYFSKEYSVSTFEFDAKTNTSVKKLVKAKLRITVAKAGKKDKDYRYDGNGVMAHEFKIEWIDAKGDSINWEGESYYAKATGKKGEFRLFDCASTNNCSDDASSKALVNISQSDTRMTISGLGRSTGADPSTNGIVLDDAVGSSVTLTLSR